MNQTLKVGYFADGPWSWEAFNYMIHDTSIEIMFVCVRYHLSDPTLIDKAKSEDIPVLKFKNINEPDVISTLSSYLCDMYISMSFNQIFRQPIIDSIRLGIINCHAGKLPFYRGRNVLNWALINDEKEFGITVHYVDTGIDTGDIILQETFPICDADTYGIILSKAHAECGRILYDALQLIQNGNVKVTKQIDIHPLGFYCGARIEGDERINWNMDSRELFNFIRAISEPAPFARTFKEGKEILIKKAVYFKDAPSYLGIPGHVLRKNEEGLLIKTKDSYLLISDYEASCNIRVGDRLG